MCAYVRWKLVIAMSWVTASCVIAGSAVPGTEQFCFSASS